MATDATGLGRYEERLLLWLLAACDGRTGLRVSTTEFGVQQNITQARVIAAADALRERCLVDVHERRNRGPLVSLRETGRGLAVRLDEERTNPQVRLRYAENALLAWAFENRGRDVLRLRAFFVADRIFFHGDALTAAEVAAAAGYLQRERLLIHTGEGMDARMTLTDRGLDCAGSGVGVAEFKEREAGRPIQVNVGGDVHGGVNLISNSTVTIMSATEFAGLVDVNGPLLQLDRDRLDQLLGEAAELRRLDDDHDDHDDHDDSGRARRLLGGIRDQLLSAPDTSARQVLLDSAQQALGRLLG